MFMRINDEIRELLNMVEAPPNRTELGESMLTHLIRNKNLSHGEAKEIVKQWNQRMGRPAERKPLAVIALEIHELQPELMWSEIASRIGYPKATQRMQSETLPAEVRHVKRDLQRYGLYRDRRRPSQ
jgi:hypothetical protein